MSLKLKGWDLVYRSVHDSLSKTSELIICFTHWYLVMERNFLCLGLGTEKTINEEDKNDASEFLPEGWNYNSNYTIRYIKNNKLYLLTGILDDDDLFIINFLNVEEKYSNSYLMQLSEIKNIKGSIKDNFPGLENFYNTLKMNIVDPVEDKTPIKTKSPAKINKPSIFRRTEPYRSYYPPPPPQPPQPPIFYEPPGFLPRLPRYPNVPSYFYQDPDNDLYLRRRLPPDLIHGVTDYYN